MKSEENDKGVKKYKKLLPVRKDQTDYVAVYKYALGCSLVHASMLFGMFFVEYPHWEAAEKFDKQY